MAMAKSKTEIIDETVRMIIKYSKIRKYQQSRKGKATKQRWRNLHREELNKRHREHRQTEKGKLIHQIGEKNRKYLKKAGGTGITTQQWENIIRKYNYRCAYCGKRCYLTQDHIIPLNKDGKHSPNNVVPACSECNTKKGIKLWQPKVFRRAK